jgi:hypothetical protein
MDTFVSNEILNVSFRFALETRYLPCSAQSSLMLRMDTFAKLSWIVTEPAKTSLQIFEHSE